MVRDEPSNFRRPATALTITLVLVLSSIAHAAEIRWRSGTVQTPEATPVEAAQAIVEMASLRAGGRTHLVVQFDAPPSDSEKAELSAGGLTLLNYLGNHAYFAVAESGRVDTMKLQAVSKLQAAMPVQSQWKLHESLVASEIMPWALVGDDGVGPELSDAAGPPMLFGAGDDRMVAAYVLFHRDVDLDGEAVSAAERNGALVRSKIRSLNGLVVELPYGKLADLAAEDSVQYIEPPLPRLTETNDSNRAITGANVAQAPPYGLDGSGVSVLVFDGGNVSDSHPDLAGRVRVGDVDVLSDHSTHVAGTVGGDGTASGGTNRGMAPGVFIESYAFSNEAPLEVGFLYTNPVDIEQDYDEAINVYGVDVANNSISSNVAGNGFPCEWEGDYGVTSALIDSIVRGSLGTPFRIVWSGTNERGPGRCGTTYRTIGPPGGAKNHLSIGALNSNNDSVTSFTGWGPTDDGRIKPDFAGPGCQQGGDNGVTSTSASGGYSVKCGTSMSAPTVTGLSALFLQDYRAHYPGADDPRNSTLKAIYAHTAVDIESPGPDYRSGYGSVRIVPALDQMRADNFHEFVLSQGESILYSVEVLPGQTQLKVTMAWDDAPGTPNVSPALVNDLDLLVRDGNGAVYYPWTLNPNSPASNAVRTQADHINNIEQVRIDNPAPGYYLIEITGFDVPEGPQPFSITASPVLLKCSRKGRVALDHTDYPCNSDVTVTVNDCHLDTNSQAIDTVDVVVASDTEPAGEIVTLFETEPDSALFVGAIAISTNDDVGVLHATDGDAISATYIDADNGFGSNGVVVVAEAVVDCTQPVISAVNANVINARTAEVTFQTDEPATGTVRYGLSCSELTGSTSVSGFKQAHSILLVNLTDEATYFYSVETIDAAGNTSEDDNGGECYSFVTPIRKEYFTELFSGDNDLSYQSVLFTPNGGEEFYTACEQQTLQLPVDPAGGVNFSLGDADSAQVILSGGVQVSLFGTSYNTLYISANGFINFGTADSDGTESIADHFNRPRVAALFDDLDPSEGGTIGLRQLADRAVVTWSNIPEDGQRNSNTFQIEMFFDGRIRMTWLGIDAADGLAGLSAGTGVPVDFFESDLSEFASCGPQAPSAAGQTVILGRDREASVLLDAIDDGLPGALGYVVTSLPAQEMRDAGNDHVIVPADLPYTLAAGGNELIYAPTDGFLGVDSFSFKANDGGSPPGGGDSNTSTVTLQVDPILSIPLFDTFRQSTFDADLWAVAHGAAIVEFALSEPTLPFSVRMNGTPDGGDFFYTHLIDLTNEENVHVEYYYERGGDGNPPDSGENLFIEYVDDQGEWQILQQQPGDGPSMSTFAASMVALPPDAYHDSFRLRIRCRGTATLQQQDDWYVDNVSLFVPGAPVASKTFARGVLDETVDVILDVSDPDGDDLDVSVLSLPSHGVLSDPDSGPILANMLPYVIPAHGNMLQYTRNGEFVGSDTFTFRADDGELLSNIGEANVFVEPVQSLPLEDRFPAISFDPFTWATTGGAAIDTSGLNIPSPPFTAHFDGQPDPGDTLRSLSYDLSGTADVHLTYQWQRTGGGDSPESADDLFFEYLDAAQTWQPLAVHLGSGPDMAIFSAADVLLPPAALHAGFRLRIRNNSGWGAEDDWFVDNIFINSVNAPVAANLSVSVHRFGWVEFNLPASDPTSDPMTRVIRTLPNNGALYDVGAGLVLIEPQDLPYTLAGGGIKVRYAPSFGTLGADSFGFRANDGQYDSNTATATLSATDTLPVYNFTMDEDPGWSTQGQWAFGVPQGLSGDPTSGFTGSNVYGYNLAGAYASSLPATYLTTTALDLGAVTGVQLDFRRWLRVESAAFDHASLEVSNNGTSWTTVWNHTGGNLLESSWSLQSYDLSAVADGQETVYLRWSMGPTDGSANFGGWNIDDVRITGQVAPTLGDMNRDGRVDLVDHWGFSQCMSGPAAAPAPPTPATAQDCLDAFDFDLDGDVDLSDYGDFGAILAAD